MTKDIQVVFEQCEDYMFQRLSISVRERCLYYHLLRHTRLIGREQYVFALVPLARALAISEWSVREDIRKLDSLGCIRIEERTRSGHLVRVLLPSEINGALPSDSAREIIDIASIDFYSDRRFVRALLEREGGACFYCLRKVSADTCALDHVIPQVTSIDHSYRNVVVTCHDCNSNKQGHDSREFLRSLYRRGLLSQADLTQRLHTLEQLEAGVLVPDISRWPSA